jgi:hypothetical protein
MKNQKRLMWLSILLAVFAHAAWADRVVPSSRVETQLKVRAKPDAHAATVGVLEPGDSAELRDSIPHWYAITLDNGKPGYVSKAWSQIIPDPVLVSDSIRLGGWNIKKLGHGDATNFALVVQIIELNFDIVAVVEVMQRSGGHPGYDTLLQRLGPGWAGMVTSKPRPNTKAGNAEFYAVLYRSQSVLPCVGWTALQYIADNEGGKTGTGPDVFSREPAFGCFAARLPNGGLGFDFMLAAYHARWDGGNTAAIKKEVRNIPNVFQAMRQARAGEEDLIIVGDFNLVKANMEEAIGSAVLTVGTGSTLNLKGERTNNLYDHLLIFSAGATKELLDKPEILDVRDVAASTSAFYRTVSDHLPIRARFRAGPDDD